MFFVDAVLSGSVLPADFATNMNCLQDVVYTGTTIKQRRTDVTVGFDCETRAFRSAPPPSRTKRPFTTKIHIVVLYCCPMLHGLLRIGERGGNSVGT
jgi:hypothetical protein